MAVARLDQSMSQLPNPQLLVRPAIRREAVSTSALEGTYAAFDEVLEADFLEESQLSVEQREVRNYVHATELAVDLMQRYPISRHVLGSLQMEIVRGTRDEAYDSGDLRQRQVAIGMQGGSIRETRLIPAPNGHELEIGFNDWQTWVNEDNEIPTIVKVALAHYQFETLHPYNNGNGRLGRLVAVLQMIQVGILRHPVLNTSPWLDANRDECIDGLLRVSKTGEFGPWVAFFSRAIQAQADDQVKRISKLLEFKETTIQSLRRNGARGAALELPEHLIDYPVIDVSTAAKLLDKTFETANQSVSRLVGMGILREITGRSKGRLFICRPVFNILNSR